MKTTQPISTISYNSVSYLKLKLDELRKAHKIAFWAFMPHKPEDDEGGLKDHCHVFIEPACSIQTEELRDEFREFDPAHPDKPFGVLPFKKSKFADWCLYALHDKRYLAMKGQTRRFHYSFDEFYTSDIDNLLFLYRTIDLVSLSPYADMMDAQSQGLSWSEYFMRGTVPIQQLLLFQRAWELLQSNNTFRSDRSNHEIDVETGEVIDNDK